MGGKTPDKKKKSNIVKYILTKMKSLNHPKGMEGFGIFPLFFPAEQNPLCYCQVLCSLQSDVSRICHNN